MSDLYSTLHQANIQFATDGVELDVVSIVVWWQRPIHEGETRCSMSRVKGRDPAN